MPKKKRRPMPNGKQRKNQDAATGQFVPGNKAAVGRSAPKLTVRQAQLTERLVAATEQHLDEIIAAIIKRALAGEGWAAKLVLERALGRPSEAPPLHRQQHLLDCAILGQARQTPAETYADRHAARIIEEAAKQGIPMTFDDVLDAARMIYPAA